jgi:hypothetical protein
MPTDDNMQNRIGNWDTIQNFMTYVSLHSTATVYYKFLSIYIYIYIYTHFVRVSVTILSRVSVTKDRVQIANWIY